MRKINFLKSIKSKKRNINERSTSKSKRSIKISRKYGKDYFDGKRDYGYGGYYYDGRWIKVAKYFKNKYKLKKGSKILDVGCAKGFLIKDLIDLGIDAYGLEISDYAINNSHPSVIGRIHKGNAKKLPFPDNSFDAVISINAIHNLNKNECLKALKEIQRVTKKYAFVQVDSYKNLKEKKIFLSWVLTAKYHDYPKNWIKLFKKAGYKGDYNWTLIN